MSDEDKQSEMFKPYEMGVHEFSNEGRDGCLPTLAIIVGISVAILVALAMVLRSASSPPL